MQDDIRQRFQERKTDRRFLTWYRLLRLVKRGVGFISPSFAQAEFSRAQFDLLSAIAFDEGRTQQLYAQRMTVTKGNITQLVVRLEKCGLITRTKIGRNRYLHLTEYGWQQLAQITPAHDALLAQLFSALSAEEIEQLNKILRKLERAMQ